MRMAFTGDSIVQRRLLTQRDPLLKPLFDRIRAADVGFTNLEVLANDYQGEPALESGGSHFGAPSWVLDELSEAGFGLMATATNHSLDYGVTGLLKTLEALDARGISHAGMGRNLEEARRPTYHTHPAGTVAMVSCSATYAKGQEASAQRPDMPGRPGLNPLGYETMHEVTEAQLAVLREVAEQLGLEEQRQYGIKMGFRFPPDDPAVFPFGAMNFRAAGDVGVKTTPKGKDVEGIARWVREARTLADIVVVSFHAHEQGATKEDPAEFLPVFARRMIDEGADVVVGHGPHLLRGMEMYRGKPIFYSLGNFVGQNELVPRLPSDSYDKFRADPEMTPGQVYWKRTLGDQGGFPADRRYWESLVPFVTFAGREVVGIEFAPVSLGLGEARHLRGRPRLAEGEEAARIFARFAALSAGFGTEIAVEGEGAKVLIS
jgi:poly-gamma-glutamate synthesis protein (capsule biosynthesis protein)